MWPYLFYLDYLQDDTRDALDVRHPAQHLAYLLYNRQNGAGCFERRHLEHWAGEPGESRRACEEAGVTAGERAAAESVAWISGGATHY